MYARNILVPVIIRKYSYLDFSTSSPMLLNGFLLNLESTVFLDTDEMNLSGNPVLKNTAFSSLLRVRTIQFPPPPKKKTHSVCVRARACVMYLKRTCRKRIASAPRFKVIELLPRFFHRSFRPYTFSSLPWRMSYAQARISTSASTTS
jgi:hypothetical protein